MLKFKRTTGGNYEALLGTKFVCKIEKHCENSTWFMVVRDLDYNEIADTFESANTKRELVAIANHCYA